MVIRERLIAVEAAAILAPLSDLGHRQALCRLMMAWRR
jgi:hypothetical protein